MQKKHRILSTVSIFHAVNDGTISVIPLLFPIFKDLFSLSYTQVGVITGGGLLFTLICQLFIGRISDRLNFRTLLATGVLFLSISMLFITRSVDFLTLLLFMLLLRFGASFFHPIGIGWVSRTFKRDKLDWAMGVQSGFGDLGAFIAVLTTLFVAEILGWRFPLYIWAIICILLLFVGMFLTKNISFENGNNRNNEYKVDSVKDAFYDAFTVLKKLKKLIPAFMISGASWGVIITFLPLLLVEKRPDLSLSSIGLIVALWIGLGSIVSFYYGRIKSLLGRKYVLLLCYLCLGISGILLSFFTDLIIILFLVILAGISVFLTFPALFSFVSEVTDESVEGKTFGYVFTFQLGGGTLLLIISGVISDIWGVWTPFALMGSLSIIVFIYLLVCNNKPFVK